MEDFDLESVVALVAACSVTHVGRSTGQTGACDHAQHVGTTYLLRLCHGDSQRRPDSTTSASKPEVVIAMSPTLENGAGMMGVFTNPSFALETACPSMTQTSI